jgi:hypothetical protein
MNYILSFPVISTVILSICTPEQAVASTGEINALPSAIKDFLQSLAIEWEPVVQLMEQQG